MDAITERLHIRDVQRADLEAMVALWTDPDVQRLMGILGLSQPKMYSPGSTT